MKLSTNAICIFIGSDATTLHLACIAGNFDTVQLLVDCDPFAPIVDAALLPNSNCVSGDTALHIACRCGHLKIVRYLLTTKHKKVIILMSLTVNMNYRFTWYAILSLKK